MEKSAIVCVPKYHRLGEGFTRREEAEAMVHPGRRTTPHGYQSAVSWISDLLALKKCIILCSFCAVKFPCHRYHYRKMFRADPTGKSSGYVTNGQCDACKQQTALLGGGVGYVYEELYDKSFMDPSAVRRKQRAMARAVPVWNFLNKQKRR